MSPTCLLPPAAEYSNSITIYCCSPAPVSYISQSSILLVLVSAISIKLWTLDVVSHQHTTSPPSCPSCLLSTLTTHHNTYTNTVLCGDWLGADQSLLLVIMCWWGGPIATENAHWALISTASTTTPAVMVATATSHPMAPPLLLLSNQHIVESYDGYDGSYYGYG